jgi:hypothetical protein
MALSERERVIRLRLKADLEYYAAACLKIRTKAGTIEPLLFNRMQRYLHQKIEDHAKRNGRVRVLILKARQQGGSTYIGARFYHRATHARGQQVFILTHEQDATDNLFNMATRFHEHCPALVKPHTGVANAKELAFDVLDSGYSVGTAGSKAVGRSKTLQLFMGSEIAHWPNAASHFAGVMQAVPDLPRTEIILESTGHGPGGEFHERYQQAEAGIGDFEAIFVPWFWSDEYQRQVPPDFALTDEEQEYSRLHGLQTEQLAWRRAKIDELRDPRLFQQEYPSTAAEAFQFSGHDSFITPEEVMRARKASCEGIGPLVIGADPARFGFGHTAIVDNFRAIVVTHNPGPIRGQAPAAGRSRRPATARAQQILNIALIHDDQLAGLGGRKSTVAGRLKVRKSRRVKDDRDRFCPWGAPREQ